MSWKLFVPLSLCVLLIVLLVASRASPTSSAAPARSAFRFRAAKCNCLSRCSNRLVSRSDFPTRPSTGPSFSSHGRIFSSTQLLWHAVWETKLRLKSGITSGKAFPQFSITTPVTLSRYVWRRWDLFQPNTTVVGFWAPFGSFLTGLASYALGRAMWSQSAGLVAIMAAFLIPDAGLLNISHPTYGYFWLQHISPGGLYGIAIAGTALILVVKGTREGRRLWIASGVVLGAVVAVSKSRFSLRHFRCCFPLPLSPGHRANACNGSFFGGCVAAGVALLPLANRFYVGPNVGFDFSDIDWYWKLLANMARGTRVESWYRVFRVGHPFPSHLVQAIGLLLINALGIFALVAPLVWLFTAWRKTWRVSEGLSAGAIALLLLMTFGLSRHGASDNVYEFIHHPFVWAYWLVGTLTAGRLFVLVSESRPQLWTSVIVVSITVLTLLPVCYGSGYNAVNGWRERTFPFTCRSRPDRVRTLHQEPASY